MSSDKRLCQMKMITLIMLLSSFKCIYACEFITTIVQNLGNDGFHRNMTYEIDIHSFEDVALTKDWPFKDCTFGLIQVLPPGLYANPDELSQLNRSHGMNAITNNTDVELPAEQSKPSYVFITHEATESSFLTWMPIHARYQKATSEEYLENEIENPELYMQCPEHRLDNCKDLKPAELICTVSSEKPCKWKELTYSLVTPSPIIWQVPVGDLNHYFIVANVTVITVVMGSVYLMWTIQTYKFKHD